MFDDLAASFDVNLWNKGNENIAICNDHIKIPQHQIHLISSHVLLHCKNCECMCFSHWIFLACFLFFIFHAFVLNWI